MFRSQNPASRIFKAFAACSVLAAHLFIFAEARADEPLAATVVHLNRPSRTVTKTLAAVFDAETSLRIVADPETNVLVLKGEQVDVQRAVEILKRIDEPQKMVTVDVRIDVAGSSGKTSAQLSDEFRLTTLSDLQAQLQVGHQQSIPTGSVQQFNGRSVSRSYQRENTGSIVRVTPRVSGDRILLSLYVEKSWLEYAKPGDDEDAAANVTPTTLTTTLETTIRLEADESRTVTSKVSGDADSSREVAITVSATTGTPPARRVRTAPRSEIDRRADSSSVRRPSDAGTTGRTIPDIEAFKGVAQRVLDRYDSNGDGKINKDEWEEMGAFGRSLESRGYKFTGELTVDELAKALRGYSSNGSINRPRNGYNRSRSSSSDRSGSGSRRPPSDSSADEETEGDAAEKSESDGDRAEKTGKEQAES